MKRTVIDCDCCKKKNVPEWETVWVIIDRQADGAGGMENIEKSVDLCTHCLAQQLSVFLVTLDHKQSKEWLNKFSVKILK